VVPTNTEAADPSIPKQGAGSIPNGSADRPGTADVPDGEMARRRRFLLIETNEEAVRPESIANAERAAAAPPVSAFERPTALANGITLLHHQIEGVRWLQTCCRVPDRRGVLLADDMGLGKTLQVLSFLAWAIESGRFPDVAAARPPYRPILLVVPLILLENGTWESEMERFFEGSGSIFMPVLNLHGERLRWLRADLDPPGRETEIGRPILDLDRIQRYRVVITNYETITNYQHSFAYLHRGKPLWSAIVTDEAQEYKTPNTKISHAIKALKADFGIASTGTPVENRLLDLWNLFDALQPGLLRSAQEFRKHYEDPIVASRSDGHLENLKRTLLFQQPHAFLLRRDKSHIGSLPPKTVIKVGCDMSVEEVALHKELIRCMRSREGRSRHLAVLQDFSRLYQHPFLLKSDAEEASASELVAGSSKLRAVFDVLHQVRAKQEKAIIFTRIRAMQSILAKTLQAEFGIPIRIINGLTQRATVSTSLRPASSRKAILEEFRARHGFNVLILSPHVAGVGLTLTEANHVIHYGRWWNPAVESQATDRVYRIGQAKEVYVCLPILTDSSGTLPTTFDERIDALMENKYRMAEDFLKPLDTEDELGENLYGELESEGATAN
jgi:SNF2 family DNA or RNA helicase